MAEELNPRMRGAYDLSSLRTPQAEVSASSSGEQAESQSDAQSAIKVQSLFIELTEANLRSFIAISQRVLVLLDFYSATNEASRLLSQKLMELVASLNGQALLCRVDVDVHARLAEAFKVSQGATFMGLLKGQPIPLTEGDQPVDVLQQLVAKLQEVAASNEVVGRVEVDANATPIDTTPKLPPAHQAAVDLLNQGQYSEAKQAYQQILRDAPADTLAIAGIAQTDLLLRLDGVDVDKVLNTAPQNFDELLQAADALIAIGDYADGFDALLKNYQDAEDAMKATIRERLLSYFEIVGKTSPEVIAARARLTSLLF